MVRFSLSYITVCTQARQTLHLVDSDVIYFLPTAVKCDTRSEGGGESSQHLWKRSTDLLKLPEYLHQHSPWRMPQTVSNKLLHPKDNRQWPVKVDLLKLHRTSAIPQLTEKGPFKKWHILLALELRAVMLCWLVMVRFIPSTPNPCTFSLLVLKFLNNNRFDIQIYFPHLGCHPSSLCYISCKWTCQVFVLLYKKY